MAAGADAALKDRGAGQHAAEVVKFPSAAPVPPELAPLVERLRNGRVVLWAGSGLDEQAGGVGYRGIVSRLLDQLPASDETAEARELLKRRPFLVAGFVRRKLGDGFAAALKAASHFAGELPAELKLLAELPFRAVVTTGYSDLIERAFGPSFAQGGGAPPVHTPEGLGKMSKEEKRRRYILKALGDPGNGTAVFSAKDLQAALGQDRLATAIRDFYKNRSILFVGLDIAVDIDRLFVRLLHGASEGDEEVAHYAVIQGLSHLEREELKATYGLHVIGDSDAFSFIRALRAAVGSEIETLPDDDDLEGWLGVLMNDPARPLGLEKIAALEKRLASGHEHERLLELHLGMTDIETTAAGRAGRLREIAGLFDNKLGEPGQAFTALLASYKEDPEHGVESDLERLANATNSWSELLQEYVAITPNLREAARADHHVRVARLYLNKLSDGAGALAALDAALKLQPQHPEALSLRMAALRKAARWPELVVAIGQAADREESLGRRAELFLEQADVLETQLADQAGAIKAYRSALDADPGSVDALSALELLFRRRSEWAELVTVIDDKAKVVGAEQARDLRLEAAAIVHEKLGDKPAAITRYEAIRGDDVASLDVLRALVGLYDSAGRTDDYLEALAAEAAATPDTAAKNAIHRRLAAEWEDREGGAARAADYLEKILAVEPKNEEALRQVQRLYAVQQKWEALVDAYRRNLQAPGADRGSLLSSIARTLGEKLNDAGRAADAWEKVLVETPDSAEAMAALTRIHENAKDWDKALALIDRRVERAKDKEGKARALYESGRIAADHKGDVKQAEERYHKALELDHTFVPAMTAMVELYRKSGEFLRAAKLLVEAEQHTANRLEKTRMLVEAGEIYDSLDQAPVAIDLLLRAMQVDPEHVEAGSRVTDLLWKKERWADALPILEMLARKEADKATMKARLMRLGKVARTLGNNEKAGRAYLKAAELDPNDAEAQRESGQVHFTEGKWQEARDAFKAVLAHGGDDLADAERVDLYYHLGECDRKLGHLDKARNFYAKALEIDPTHRPTILARIDVDSDDPRKIVEAKRALLATATKDEQFKLLSEIGDTNVDALNDFGAAATAYREALALRPDTRHVLHKALEAYVELKDWLQADEMLTRLVEIEKDLSVRAKLRFTRAMVHLEELSDTETAIKLLNEAHDDDPTSTRISGRIEELLAKVENWKELQRFLRKLVKGMRPDADQDTPEQRKERLRVWAALADVSIEKLNEVGVGLSALEVAATFGTEDDKRREQLADLYAEAGPDYVDKAITAHQQLVKEQHDRIASYRALRQLYGTSRQQEKAISVAYALDFLKKGAPEDRELVAEAKKRQLQPARRNLDEDMWSKHLQHHDEDRYLCALFGVVTGTLSLANGQKPEEASLDKKDAVGATDGRGFAKGIRYVAGALNVTMPYDTYVRYELRDPLSIINTLETKGSAVTPMANLIVGQPLLGDKRSERELVFELTKRLAYFRSDRYLRFVLTPAAQLALVIEAAISLGAEADRDKGATSAITKIAQDFKRSLQPQQLEQVQAIGKKLKGGKAPIELANAWLAATELTASRAAFLLVGDLETTARFIAAEPATVSTHPPMYRLKELIWFSVSEDCFALRQHLGLMG